MANLKKQIVGVLKQEDTVQLLREIREGIANQSTLLNEKLTKIAEELVS